MAKIYTPGLKVTSRIMHRARRQLPIAGQVKVKIGDRVDAADVVAETHMPGAITPVNVANILALPPADVPECMLKREGDRIDVGEPLARTKGIFGFLRKEHRSPVAGTIESISSVTGQIIIRGAPLPVQVKAYVCGTVVEIISREGCVIETDATFIQGIFGVGGETSGIIRMACRSQDQELTADLITPDMAGCVVVGGSRVTDAAIARCRSVGARAIVGGGLDDQDLRDLLGYDLGVAITGSEDIGITLVITEGFGDIAMAARTFQLLRSREGDEASVNGATQIRAGVMRPEIIIPLTDAHAREKEPRHSAGYLEIGMPVRIIRDPYFGLLGTVTALPTELAVLASGSKARVLEVRLDSGESVSVPRANVELIEA